jgi:hypothetical protein
LAEGLNSYPGAVLTEVDTLTPGLFRESAWHSRIGDCIFYYISDVPSYAERLYDDLPLFWSFAKKEITGCKLKNIEAIRKIFM